MSQNKVYLNGQLVPSNEARLSVFDRGLLYGDGVFESLRTYGGKPFLLEQHVKRLLASLKTLKIKAPLSAQKLKLAVLKTLAANRFKEAYLKIIITRGQAKAHGLDPSNTTGRATVIILVEELTAYPKTLYVSGWEAIISTRAAPETSLAQIKSLGYLNNIMAKIEAKAAGADEAFLLDSRGNLTEGTVSNLFLVKFGTILTPPKTAAILPGITRNLIIKLAKQAALPLIEKNLSPKELYTADECFVTMAGAGVVPVTRVWQKKISRGKCGPITASLIKLYQAETEK